MIVALGALDLDAEEDARSLGGQLRGRIRPARETRKNASPFLLGSSKRIVSVERSMSRTTWLHGRFLCSAARSQRSKWPASSWPRTSVSRLENTFRQ